MNFDEFEKIEEFRNRYNELPDSLQTSIHVEGRSDFDHALIDGDIYIRINNAAEYQMIRYFRYLNSEYSDFYKYVVCKHYYDNTDKPASYPVAEFQNKYDAIDFAKKKHEEYYATTEPNYGVYYSVRKTCKFEFDCSNIDDFYYTTQEN